MMLVQKPQPALSSMSFSHRRQTSAPVVVVQPTRIPGLLSLSKPPRSSPRNQQRHNTKNAPKQALATSATVPPTVVRAHAHTLTPAAQIYTAPATPSPQSRGRAQEKHLKDKNLHNKRSASQSSLRGSGKHHGRQPSPPIPSTMVTSNKQKLSQAEVPANFANFDPFLDQSTLSPPLSPRRQPRQSQSKAIPVPASSIRRTPALARSNPLPILSSRQPRYKQQRPSLISTRTNQEFPICDDMSEIADDDHEPSTPIARRLYQRAPLQSAPISTPTLDFFPTPQPSPSPQQKKNEDWSRNRKHRRTPSDGGVFHMSSDEEVSSGPGGTVLNRNLTSNVKALPGSFDSPASKTREMNSMTPARADAAIRAGVVEGSTMNMSRSIEKAAFFASSVFLNSPSPDELPDPLSL